jgi:phosphoglucosamine mutase
MEHYPQALISVPVENRVVASSGTVKEAVVKAEERLGTEGRILLRPSGTESVVRVMVEHEEEAVCREVCEEVASVVASGSWSGSEVRT